MATGNGIVATALTDLGVVPVGESVPTEMTTMGLAKLNALLAFLAAEGQHVYVLTEGTFALTPAQAVYTIGSGGNFNVARPVEIVSADLTASGVTRPLDVSLSMFRYDAYATKPAGTPTELYWDPTMTTAKLTLYPTPNAADSLHLRSITALATITDGTVTLVLPPEYEWYLASLLTEALMLVYPQEALKTTLIRNQAVVARAAIQRNAVKRMIRTASMDRAVLPVNGYAGNITTGD